MKHFIKALAVLLIALMLLPTIPTAVSAAGPAVISFTNPVITTDTGKTVDLSAYAVEFAAGSTAISSGISWKSDDITVSDNKVAPASSGLYRLTATASSKSKIIYLAVKNPADTEFVLYYNDFSDPLTGDIKTVQQSSGATVSIADGKLILDASNSASSYIRLIFPSFLSDFADYNIETSTTMTAATDSAKWMSVMFRIQKSDYPYWQFCLRQNMKASNGTEFAERTAANAWSVTHTAAYSETINSGKYYNCRIEAFGGRAATYIDGTRMHFSDKVSDNAGGIGFQVRGSCAVFDHIKVTVRTEKLTLGSTTLNEVGSPKSNIILSPTTASYIDSTAKLADIHKISPATAIFYTDKNLNVTDMSGAPFTTVDKAIQALDGRVIPGFYVTDKETVTALCEYLENNKINDVLVISSDPELVRSARDAWMYVRGAVDFTAAKLDDLYSLRNTANTAGARIVILPAVAADYATVEYLQRLFMTVWTDNTADATITGHVRSITSGAYGIISSDIAGLKSCFTSCFKENTAVRPIIVIGHRGVPSLAQENSIAGSALAYELGATMVETDIYLTTDGVIFAMHDGTLDRTTTGTGATASVSSAMLSKLKIDLLPNIPTEPVPTLEDYFKEFRGKDIQMLVEIKTSSTSIIDPLVRLIEEYDIADQVNIIAFSEEQISLMKQKMPGMSVGYLSSTIPFYDSEPLVTLQSALEKTQRFDTTFNPSYSGGSLGPRFIETALHRGMILFPWTFRNQADLDAYIMYGVSVSTDYTQYVTDYIKRLSIVSGSVRLDSGGSLPFPVIKTTYGRQDTEITDAEMVVLEKSGDIAVTYSNGILSTQGTGAASVIFRLAAKTTSGQTYYVSTQPVVVKSGDTEFTAAPATETQEPSDTRATDDTTGAPKVNNNNNVSAPAAMSGALIAVIAVAVIAVGTAAIIVSVITKKRK